MCDTENLGVAWQHARAAAHPALRRRRRPHKVLIYTIGYGTLICNFLENEGNRFLTTGSNWIIVVSFIVIFIKAAVNTTSYNDIITERFKEIQASYHF